MEFKQVDASLNRFIFKIEETGIRIIRKRTASSTETFVDFEDIGSKTIREKSYKLIWLILSIIFLMFAAGVFIKRLQGGNVGDGAELFHLTACIILFTVFLLTRKNILFLTQSDNTNAIEFSATEKYQSRVDDFIKHLLYKRDQFLIQKYSTIDEFLPYSQQYNNLVWLYNLKLLTKEQLQSKIQELDNIDNSNDQLKKNNLVKIVGFSKRTEPKEEDLDEEDDT